MCISLTDTVVGVDATGRATKLANGEQVYWIDDQSLHESPTRDSGIATTVTAIDFVLETENAVVIAEINGGVVIQIANTDIILLSGAALDAGVLCLSSRESALESALLAVVALASSFDVISSVALVLEHITTAKAGGSNAVDTGTENNGESGKDISGLHAECFGSGMLFLKR